MTTTTPPLATCPTGCAIHDCLRCGGAHAHVAGPHACPTCGHRYPDLRPVVVTPDYHRHPDEERTTDPDPNGPNGYDTTR